jgi:hypothetical protein
MLPNDFMELGMATTKKNARTTPKEALKPVIEKRVRVSKKTDPLNFKSEDWYGRAWEKFSISKGSLR